MVFVLYWWQLIVMRLMNPRSTYCVKSLIIWGRSSANCGTDAEPDVIGDTWASRSRIPHRRYVRSASQVGCSHRDKTMILQSSPESLTLSRFDSSVAQFSFSLTSGFVSSAGCRVALYWKVGRTQITATQRPPWLTTHIPAQSRSSKALTLSWYARNPALNSIHWPTASSILLVRTHLMDGRYRCSKRLSIEVVASVIFVRRTYCEI